MIRYAPAILAALIATSAGAAERSHSDRVAQIVFLAQAAPKTCTDYKTDDNAVASYMANEKMSQRDFMTGHLGAIKEIAEVFAGSIKRDPVVACDQIWKQIGEPGLGLIAMDDD